VRGTSLATEAPPAPAHGDPASASDPATAETALIQALRRGDEAAFRGLVDALHRSLLRVALRYVNDEAAAEDVVQDTWMGFMEGIHRFEGRCSVKTWLFRILFNKAKTRAVRDRRFIPFSVLTQRETASGFSAVDPSHFHSASEGGTWATRPATWHTDPERVLQDREARMAVDKAIAQLPPAQGTVMLMRDVEGFSAREVCNALQISATNQRVLLHRARSTVRAALSGHYGADV